jgi:hypothetical protein
MTISGTPSRASRRHARVGAGAGEAPTDAGRDGRPAQLRSGGRTGPFAGLALVRDDAEQRADLKLDSQLEPRAKLLPGPFVHPDLAPSSALGAADEQRAAAVIEIGFGEAESFLDASPGAPEDHD